MAIDTKKHILLAAWEIIKDDIRIKKAYFFPWLLSIVFLTVLLVYQSIYTYVVIFHQKEKALELILNFFHSDYVLETLITAIIFLIFYLSIIPIFEWWLISYLSKKDTDKSASIGDALSVWIYRFLPLFEYSNLFSEFKFINVLNWYLFIIRFFEWQYIKQITYSFIFLYFLSAIINILLAYSKYIIVLENKKLFDAISKSTKLAILNLITTVKLYLFMFILNTRVIINFIVFLIFPVIIVLTIWLITSQIFMTIAVSMLVIIFILFVLFLWYFTWVLEIFKTAIWYFAYKDAQQKLINLNEEDKEDK